MIQNSLTIFATLLFVLNNTASSQVRQLNELNLIKILGKSSVKGTKISIHFKNTGNQNLSEYAFRLTYTHPKTPFSYFAYFRPNELSSSGQKIKEWKGNVPEGGNLKLDCIRLGTKSLTWNEFKALTQKGKKIKFNVTTKNNGGLIINRVK